MADKQCSKCHLVKDLGEFCKNSNTRDRRTSWCRKCYAERKRPPSENRRHKLPGYVNWRAMIARCNEPNHKGYYRYGGRGIAVVPEWIGWGGYERFIAHIGPKPSSTHQIDRIDNNGNYEPGNVRWVLPRANSRNKSNTRELTCRGETMTIPEWEDRMGMQRGTIRGRLKHGWAVEDAIFRPLSIRRKQSEDVQQ